MYILAIQNSSLWVFLLGAAAAGFVAGMLFKYAIVLKQKRRILKLEDEMLANHSRILALEKKVSEARKNGVQIEYDINAHKVDRDLKVS